MAARRVHRANFLLLCPYELSKTIIFSKLQTAFDFYMPKFLSPRQQAKLLIGFTATVLLISSTTAGATSWYNNPMTAMMWAMADIMGFTERTPTGFYNTWPGSNQWPEQSYGYPNPTRPPLVNNLPISIEGLWEGRNGERLSLQNGHFELRAPPIRRMTGRYKIHNGRILFQPGAQTYPISYELLINPRYIVLYGAANEMLVFRRMRF